MNVPVAGALTVTQAVELPLHSLWGYGWVHAPKCARKYVHVGLPKHNTVFGQTGCRACR
jgi:hypothetical protein